MKTMTWIKFKFAAGVCTAILVAGGAVTAAISQTTASGGDGWMPQELARESQAAYAAMSSYSDSGTVITEGEGINATNRFHLRLQRSNLYRIDWNDGFSGGIVWSDGTGNFMVMGSGGLMRKVEKMQDMETTLGSATGVSGQASATIPGTFFGQNWGNVLKVPSSNKAHLKKEMDATIGGVTCHVFSSIKDPTKLPNNMGNVGTITTTLWIGQQDHLIHQIRMVMENTAITPPQLSDADLGKTLQQQNQTVTPETIANLRNTMSNSFAAAKLLMGKNPTFTFIQTHENIQVNPKFSPGDFTR